MGEAEVGEAREVDGGSSGGEPEVVGGDASVGDASGLVAGEPRDGAFGHGAVLAARRLARSWRLSTSDAGRAQGAAAAQRAAGRACPAGQVTSPVSGDSDARLAIRPAPAPRTPQSLCQRCVWDEPVSRWRGSPRAVWTDLGVSSDGRARRAVPGSMAGLGVHGFLGVGLDVAGHHRQQRPLKACSSASSEPSSASSSAFGRR